MSLLIKQIVQRDSNRVWQSAYYLKKDAIKQHFLDVHGRKVTRKEIVDMKKAQYYQSDFQRLEILKALIILFEDPLINRQDTGKKKILKLYATQQHPVVQLSSQQ